MLDHGGNLKQAMAYFGGNRDEWHDLSAGLNPNFYPVSEHIVRAEDWHRLPEMNEEFLNAAREYYQCENLLAVAGSQAAIQALPRILSSGILSLQPQSRVVVSSPSYAEHLHQWTRSGYFEVCEVPYLGLANAVSKADIMVVCNPNNPTGELIQPELLLEWAEYLACRGGFLIVDEAFADLQPHYSVASYTEHAGLIVLRSFGKFFGLAGARLGFVAAQNHVLNRLAAHLGPWAVGEVAQNIARLALQDQLWQKSARQTLSLQGLRLRQLLSTQGIQSAGTDLFQWCSEQSLQGRSQELWQFLAERRIWTRLFRQSAKGLRFGLPANELAWQALHSALQSWGQHASSNFSTRLRS